MSIFKNYKCKSTKGIAKFLVVALIMTVIMSFSIPAFAATTATFNFSVDNGIGYANAFGGAINHLDAAADIDNLRSVGINFARRDAYLSEIVPNTTIANYKNNVNNVADPSTWDWSKYAWVDLYHSKGIKTMLILSYNVPWNSYSGTMHGVPRDWAVYQDIIKKIYQHFQGKVAFIEVYNEPDIGFLDRTGSPYTDQCQAYIDIYYNAVTAIRSVDANIPIGGPALAYSSNTSWLHAMFSDSRINNNINFLSYHYYQTNPDGEPQIAEWRNIAASYGKPNIPIFITEWNYTAAYNKDPMNNGSVDAIPYVAQRLNDMLRNHINGTGYFAFNKDGYLESDFYALFSDGSLTPKMSVYKLLSKKLGLGEGDFNFKGSSWVNGAAAIIASSAVNSSGNRVGYVINNTSTGDNLVVNISGLQANTYYTADLYEASRWQDASEIRETYNFTTNSSGSASLSFWLPYKSVVGLKFSTATSPTGAYRASTGFGSTQGANNWYYQQWNGSAYSNMTWDSANSRWKGTAAGCLINNNWQHPDAQDSVRKWVAPTAGTIRITAASNISVASGGDGVKVRVLHMNSNIWPSSDWEYIGSGSSRSFPQTDVTVAAGDAIYFMVNKNNTNAYDTTTWDPVIAYVTTPMDYKASVGFSSTQGVNQWYYQQWNGSSYSNMTWNSSNSSWKGTDGACFTGNNWQHPDNQDSVRKWVAPRAGSIRITCSGNISVVPGGDGVRVKVLKNSANLWPSSGWSSIAGGGYAIFPEKTVTVAAGDAIYFIVNKNGTNAYDTTSWNPVITYLN